MGLFSFFSKKPQFDALKLTIREATADDARDIANLIARDLVQSPNPYYERTLLDLKNPSQRHVTVACVEDVVVGYGRLRFCQEARYAYPGPFGWYLMGVVVDPSFRRRGIARRITDYRLQWLKKKTNEAFYITNTKNKASISLHKSFGFHAIEESHGFMNIDFKDDQAVLFIKRWD